MGPLAKIYDQSFKLFTPVAFKHRPPAGFFLEGLAARTDPSAHQTAIWILHAYRARLRRGEPTDTIESGPG